LLTDGKTAKAYAKAFCSPNQARINRDCRHKENEFAIAIY